jgi:uncharacterized protein (DUF2141 family)
MRYPLFLAVLFAAYAAQAGELKLELEGKGMAGNQVRVAIYSASAPEQFSFDDKFYRGSVSEATGDQLTVLIPDLPPGRYAVAAYVDSNRNGRLDKNFLGMPKEIFGFSNNVRGMFGPPDFDAAVFEIGAGIVTKSIQLY